MAAARTSEARRRTPRRERRGGRGPAGPSRSLEDVVVGAIGDLRARASPAARSAASVRCRPTAASPAAPSSPEPGFSLSDQPCPKIAAAGQRDRGGGIPRGKSGHRRARRWVTPTRGNPRESATETNSRWRRLVRRTGNGEMVR